MIKRKLKELISMKPNFGNLYIERNPLNKNNLDTRKTMWRVLLQNLALDNMKPCWK